MIKFWKKLNELYGWLIIAVFGFIMLIGIWQVCDNYYIFYHALDKSILQYKPDPKDPAAQKESPITDEMVGWLTIDGTNIDYPVMQGKDNSHFLNTDPFGEYSLTGSIFLDSRSSPDFTDDFSLFTVIIWITERCSVRSTTSSAYHNSANIAPALLWSAGTPIKYMILKFFPL